MVMHTKALRARGTVEGVLVSCLCIILFLLINEQMLKFPIPSGLGYLSETKKNPS